MTCKFKAAPCPFCGQDTDYEIEWFQAVELTTIGFGPRPPWARLPNRFWVKCERCKSVWYEPENTAETKPCCPAMIHT